MKIGLIAVDGHNYPNIPLMKLAAWHKQNGDMVEWYEPLFSGHMDRVYMSKVFSFTPDYQYCIDADQVIKGGSGYCIETVDGIEVYPRGCNFCHVAAKEGKCSVKVADLSEFWKGQKNIVLCDPNVIACRDWKNLLWQLIDSGATVNINQGIDARMLTDEKMELLRKIKVDSVHFAWDRYEDKEIIVPKLKAFKEITGWGKRKMSVYVLTNFNTTIEQDLERIYTLRDLGYNPYVMIYNKEATKGNDTVRLIQRWVNNRKIFNSIKWFSEYDYKRG